MPTCYGSEAYVRDGWGILIFTEMVAENAFTYNEEQESDPVDWPHAPYSPLP